MSYMPLTWKEDTRAYIMYTPTLPQPQFKEQPAEAAHDTEYSLYQKYVLLLLLVSTITTKVPSKLAIQKGRASG